MTRTMALLRLDVDTLSNTLAIVADGALHRGESDTRGALVLLQRHVEDIAEQLERLAIEGSER